MDTKILTEMQQAKASPQRLVSMRVEPILRLLLRASYTAGRFDQEDGQGIMVDVHRVANELIEQINTPAPTLRLSGEVK